MSTRVSRAVVAAVALIALTGACSSSSQPSQAAAASDASSTSHGPLGAASPSATGAPTSASSSASPHVPGTPGSSGSSSVSHQPTTGGSLLWVGDPGKGQSVFYLNNCAAPGAISTADDPQKGLVWQYTKPAGDKRCESHGIQINGAKYTFQNNSTYYIGWWSKLTDLTDNNADFQWKSYGSGMIQNYPFVISVHSGHAGVWQQQPNVHGVTAWTSAQPLVPNQWVHYVVGVHTSDQLTGGWIELWFNGVQQRFVDGSTQYRCRTFDVQNDPKWGEYGALDADVTNYVTAQKIGTSYDAVAN